MELFGNFLLDHFEGAGRFGELLQAINAAESDESVCGLHAVDRAGVFLVHRAFIIDGPGGEDGDGHRETEEERGKECFHGMWVRLDFRARYPMNAHLPPHRSPKQFTPTDAQSWRNPGLFLLNVPVFQLRDLLGGE